MENSNVHQEPIINNQEPIIQNKNENSVDEKSKLKKKVTLEDFKVKSFVTNVKVEQMQFLKTAGG